MWQNSTGMSKVDQLTKQNGVTNNTADRRFSDKSKVFCALRILLWTWTHKLLQMCDAQRLRNVQKVDHSSRKREKHGGKVGKPRPIGTFMYLWPNSLRMQLRWLMQWLIFSLCDTFLIPSENFLMQFYGISRRNKLSRVDFICDAHPPMSIKNIHNSRHAQGGFASRKDVRKGTENAKPVEKGPAGGYKQIGTCWIHLEDLDIVEASIQCWSCDQGDSWQNLPSLNLEMWHLWGSWGQRSFLWSQRGRHQTTSASKAC